MATTISEHLTPGPAAPTWDDLAGPHFYSTAAWLGFCQAHGGALQHVAVARRGDAAVAVVPFAELIEAPGLLYRWSDLLAERGLPSPSADGLLVGPRQGYQTHLLVAPGMDRRAAAAELVARLRERAAGRACVAMYTTTRDALALRDAGVRAEPVLLEADASLELPSGGWDAWLGSLPARRRTNIAREVRAFEGAGYEVTHGPLADCFEQLPGLAGSTQAKYGHVAATAEHLESLRKHVDNMGSAARVAVCRRPGEEPVGFCLYYVHGDTIFLRWAGFDYDRLAGAAEYFNLVYYNQVRLAAELGATRIHAGIKATEAKALRGARLQPLWLVDLTEDSPLAAAGEAVRAHNARAYEELVRGAPVTAGLADNDDWQVFS